MNKIQRATIKGIATAIASIIAVSPVFAAGWQQDASGWWYGTNADNTTWYYNGWQWIDGNGDGTAECYYFGADGYLYQGGTTPEGYTVNADGAWTENGIVRTKNVSAVQHPAESARKHQPVQSPVQLRQMRVCPSSQTVRRLTTCLHSRLHTIRTDIISSMRQRATGRH